MIYRCVDLRTPIFYYILRRLGASLGQHIKPSIIDLDQKSDDRVIASVYD